MNENKKVEQDRGQTPEPDENCFGFYKYPESGGSDYVVGRETEHN
jgi:hypothetical protein